MERSGRGTVSLEEMNKTTKKIRIAGLGSEIRTQDFLNMGQENYNSEDVLRQF
jgi:hypothetical protein